MRGLVSACISVTPKGQEKKSRGDGGDRSWNNYQLTEPRYANDLKDLSAGGFTAVVVPSIKVVPPRLLGCPGDVSGTLAMTRSLRTYPIAEANSKNCFSGDCAAQTQVGRRSAVKECLE